MLWVETQKNEKKTKLIWKRNKTELGMDSAHFLFLCVKNWDENENKTTLKVQWDICTLVILSIETIAPTSTVRNDVT